MLRSADGEALLGILPETLLELTGVRPRTVRPWRDVVGKGPGDDGEVEGVLAFWVETNCSRSEPLKEGERAPFWLEVVTERFCVAVVAPESKSEPPPTELGALV